MRNIDFAVIVAGIDWLRFSAGLLLNNWCSSSCVIVRVSVVLRRTVVVDWHFDHLGGSHLQSQVNGVFQSMVL